MRVCVFAIIALLIGACASPDTTIHALGSRSWAQTPTVPEGMSRRVEESAVEFQPHAPVPRIGFFDIAFPSSSSELLDTGGYGVLLLTALSQDQSELPPKRLYITLNGKEHALSLISSTKGPQKPSSNVERVLGANRWDALYSFPVYLMQDGAALSMDFAKNRDGFVLGKFSTADRDALTYGMSANKAPTGDGTQSDAVMRLVAREYPGFLDRAP